jgi:hypothetical protein
VFFASSGYVAVNGGYRNGTLVRDTKLTRIAP